MSGSGNYPAGGRGPSRTFQTPAGFRDSPEPVLSAGEVVASQYTARREVARSEGAALIEAWDMLLERTVLLKDKIRLLPGVSNNHAKARKQDELCCSHFHGCVNLLRMKERLRRWATA